MAELFRRLRHGLYLVLLLAFGCGVHPDDPNLDWDPASATFRWWGGEVAFPAGYSYQRVRGIDSSVGRFTSPDGQLVIKHDIGRLAGVAATRKGAMLFEEHSFGGARYYISHAEFVDQTKGLLTRATVSFPESRANFYMSSDAASELGVIHSIARSFRPSVRYRAVIYFNRLVESSER